MNAGACVSEMDCLIECATATHRERAECWEPERAHAVCHTHSLREWESGRERGSARLGMCVNRIDTSFDCRLQLLLLLRLLPLPLLRSIFDWHTFGQDLSQHQNVTAVISLAPVNNTSAIGFFLFFQSKFQSQATLLGFTFLAYIFQRLCLCLCPAYTLSLPRSLLLPSTAVRNCCILTTKNEIKQQKTVFNRYCCRRCRL